MPFARDTLYGWGVFRIMMPRSSRDIYADRRAGKSSRMSPERRKQVYFQSFPAILADLLRQDFPAGTSLAVASAALAAIVLFSLSSLLIPRPLEEVPPEPMEIVARIMEEPLALPRPLEDLSVEEPPVKKPPAAPKPAVKVRPVVLTEPLPIAPARKLTVASVPEKPVPAPPPQKIVVRVRPRQARAVELIVPEKAQRSYDLPQKRPARLPEASRSTVLNAEPRVERVASATTIRKNFRADRNSAANGVLPRGKVNLPAATGTTVELPAVEGIKQNLGRPHSQGDGAAPITGRSFSPDGPSGVVVIGRGRVTAKSYHPSAGATGGIAAPPGASREFSAGLGLPGAEPVLNLPVADKTGRGLVAGNLQGQEPAVALAAGINFVTEQEGEVLDPSLLVSLSQLSACIDQSEEDRLRTRLAILLDRNGQCRSGEMIFFFQNPDTGWTMQVDLYKPVDFADRCSALLAAIECINHLK